MTLILQCCLDSSRFETYELQSQLRYEVSEWAQLGSLFPPHKLRPPLHRFDLCAFYLMYFSLYVSTLCKKNKTKHRDFLIGLIKLT